MKVIELLNMISKDNDINKIMIKGNTFYINNYSSSIESLFITNNDVNWLDECNILLEDEVEIIHQYYNNFDELDDSKKINYLYNMINEIKDKLNENN